MQSGFLCNVVKGEFQGKNVLVVLPQEEHMPRAKYTRQDYLVHHIVQQAKGKKVVIASESPECSVVTIGSNLIVNCKNCSLDELATIQREIDLLQVPAQ